jgi:formate-dependent nitrite reductase membrane component NrfD
VSEPSSGNRAEHGHRRHRRTRWSLREPAGDEGARDRLAQLWDRGLGRRSSSSVAGGPDDAEAGGAGSSSGRIAGRAAGQGPGPRGRGRRRRGGGGDDGSREQSMVPRATFTSYYGRPVLKPPAWEDDIAYYFFLGGLAACSSGLAAGADLTGRPALRRGGRVGALAALGAGSYYLIRDLGRPERFHHMLRVAKPTSPMSMGTWILAAYGLPMGLAAVDELMPGPLRRSVLGRLVGAVSRPAGLAAAAISPAVAAYTAVLCSQTAVPSWHEAHEELPFIFTASAAASAAGLGMIVAPVAEAAPARRLATYGAVVELLASRRLETRLGLLAEPYTTGKAHAHLQRASTLTAAGSIGGMMFGRRSRIAAVLSGVALLAGGFYERLGILEAGRASTKDPKYVVQPQRERLERRRAEQGLPSVEMTRTQTPSSAPSDQV